MSSVNTGRIKQIRQMSGGSFNTPIPIGTNGYLVDMFSQLDLEEEIRVGGNHYVTINQNNISTIIKEWYFSEPKGNTPIDQIDDDIVTYTVMASIANAVQTRIGSVKDVDDFVTWKDSQDYDEEDPTTFGDYLVTREEVDSHTTLIILELYRGNFETKLHEKRIHIYEAANGDIAVDEQVDQENSLNPFEQEVEP